MTHFGVAGRATVEIISPGTRRTDRILKAAEYATAGIPRYWVIDLTESTSITTRALRDRSRPCVVCWPRDR